MAFNIKNAVMAMEERGSISDQLLMKEIEDTQNGIRASLESYMQAVNLIGDYDVEKANYGVSTESFMGVSVEDKGFLSKVGSMVLAFFKAILKGVMKMKDLLVKFFKWIGDRSLSAKRGIDNLLKKLKESYDYLKDAKKRKYSKSGKPELDKVHEEIEKLLGQRSLILTLGSNKYYRDQGEDANGGFDPFEMRLTEFATLLDTYNRNIRTRDMLVSMDVTLLYFNSQVDFQKTISEEYLRDKLEKFTTSMTKGFTEKVPGFDGFLCEKGLFKIRHPLAATFAVKEVKNVKYFEDILEAGFSVLMSDHAPLDREYKFHIINAAEGILTNSSLKKEFTPEFKGSRIIEGIQSLEIEIERILEIGEEMEIDKRDFFALRESGKFMISFLNDYLDTYVVRFGKYLMKTRNALLKDVENWNEALSNHVYAIEKLYAKADALENKTKEREVKKRTFGMRDRDFGE